MFRDIVLVLALVVSVTAPKAVFQLVLPRLTHDRTLV